MNHQTAIRTIAMVFAAVAVLAWASPGVVIAGIQDPNVSLVKDAVATPITFQQHAQFEVTVTNASTVDATTVTVTDPLPGPASLLWIVAPPAGATCTPTSPVPGGTTLMCNLGTPPPGETRVITLTANPPLPAAACGPLVNVATVTADVDSNPDDNTDEATIFVQCPDVSVIKSATPATTPLDVGGTAQFDIRVTAGGNRPSQQVVLRDVLPVGFSWTVALTGGGSCQPPASPVTGGGELVCNFGQLAVGATRDIRLTATVTEAGAKANGCVIRNTARVSATVDIDPGNNESSASIGIDPDVCPTDSDLPGSVLVFHKFIRGSVTVGQTTTRPRQPILEPRSEFQISVTCPGGATCPEGQDVRLLARWVCPASQQPSQKFVCKAVNFRLSATVKGTIVFNPDNVGTARTVDVPAPPCQRGFLVVWVVDNDANQPRAIKFDGLLGAAVLRNGPSSAGAYTPHPIQAADGLATGARTDVNNDGNLQFDGTEYRSVTGLLRAPIRLERTTPPAGTNLGRIRTFLTMLTLDTLANRPNFPTFVDFHFFNEGETLLSVSHEFICWKEVQLTAIDPNLDEFFGAKALFETTGAEKEAIFGVDDNAGPVTLLGIVETQELNAGGQLVREYSYRLFNDGQPVPTTFEP